MAETIRGINVVIGADTTKLGKALEDVNKKSRNIQSELRQVERLLKFDPKNTTLLAQKQQLLSQAIENTNEKLNRLKSVQQQVADQFKRGEISEGQYRAFQREIAKTEQELKSLQGRLSETNSSIERHASSWARLQDRLERVGKNFRDVGQRMRSVGKSVATSMGAATAAIGGALGFAVKTSMDFEAQMDRVGAIAGANSKELKAMEKAALDLGASTSKSASEVAEGMELMAAMGYNANQIIAAMPGVIAAAEASGEDMALVAETVAAALNSFGLEAKEASRVADVLAQSANMSAAGISDMQYAFKYAAPVAKSLGISLEELSAAVAIMSNAGIRGEQAGTTLRAALLRLSKPPKEAAKALDSLGVSITDAHGNMRPFIDIIAQLSEKTANLTNAQKMAALSTIFGTEAASGMLTVVEAGPQKLDALTKSLQNSAGASQEAAQKMKDNLKGSLEELQGSIETAQITIGNALAPMIQKVAETVQGLVDKFNNLSPSTQRFLAIAAALTAVVLGLGTAIGIMLTIIGGAINGIGAIAMTFGKLSGAIANAGGMAGMFSKALGFLPGPVGLAVAAITGLIAIGVLLWKNWDTIKAKAKELKDGLVNAFKAAGDKISDIWSGIWSTIKGFINKIIDGINKMIGGLNKLKFKAPDWVPFIGGKSFGINIPKIPRLARGGVVSDPTLAVVGDAGPGNPEIVAPKKMLKDILKETLQELQGNTGSAQPLVIQLQVDGRTLAETTFRDIKELIDFNENRRNKFRG
jgi:phage tail tape measure protein, TP901 family, core region